MENFEEQNKVLEPYGLLLIKTLLLMRIVLIMCN
jgi:hypothetical protein